MVKLVGSLLVLAGGGLLWYTRMRAWRTRRNALQDLAAVLRAMGEEIRMTRTPMPRLLRKLAGACGGEVQAFLRSTAAAAETGERLSEVWRNNAAELPLSPREREILTGLELQGDEECVCRAVSLAALQMARCAEALEQKRPEETKRTSAVCFSCAALLVILLI